MAGSTLFTALREKQNRIVLLKLIRYSLLMVFFPLATFFFVWQVWFKGDMDYLGWSGIAAVIATNIVIALYVVSAWNEVDEIGEPGRSKMPLPKED